MAFNQFTAPKQTHGQKIVEYFKSHGWKNRVGDDGHSFWLGGFTSLVDPSRVYIIKYRPVGTKDAGTMKVRILTNKEVYSDYTHDKKILGFDELKRFIKDIQDIACYR